MPFQWTGTGSEPSAAAVSQASGTRAPTTRPVRLQVFSDLHGAPAAEVIRPARDVDAVVRAGDFGPDPRSTFEGLRRLLPTTTPIVCVLGDDEYHGQVHEDVLRSARELAPSFGVALLQDDVTVIGGVRYVGSTFWTGFRLNGEDGDTVGGALDAGMIDGMRMRSQERTPLLGLRDAVAALALTVPFDAPTVVVPHRAPSARSPPHGFEGDLLAPAHASPAEACVTRCGASLWTHGHVHAPKNYAIGPTRVLANP